MEYVQPKISNREGATSGPSTCDQEGTSAARTDVTETIRGPPQRPRTVVEQAIRGSYQQPRTGMRQAIRGITNQIMNICTYNTRTINDLNTDSFDTLIYEFRRHQLGCNWIF